MDKKVFIFIAVFVISLDSYLRVRGVLGISFLFLYLLSNKFSASLEKKYILPIGIMSLGFVFYTILAVFFPEIYLQIPEDKEIFYYKILDRFSLVILFVFICLSFKNKDYVLILRKVAMIHIFYLLIQFFFYYGIGLKIDILSWFDISQRTGMVYSGAEVYRPAGFYWEPSNFAAYVLALFLPYLITKSDYNKLDYLLPISIILTLSSAAFLVGIIVLISMLMKTGLIKKPKILFLLIFLLIPIMFFGYASQKSRFSEGVKDNANTILRTNLVEYVYSSRINSPTLFLTGVGLYSYDIYIKNEEESIDGRMMASIQDASFFVFTFLLTGILGLFLLLIVFFKIKGFSNKFLLIAFMLTKISFVYPVFLFFIYFIFNSKLNMKK